MPIVYNAYGLSHYMAHNATIRNVIEATGDIDSLCSYHFDHMADSTAAIREAVFRYLDQSMEVALDKSNKTDTVKVFSRIGCAIYVSVSPRSAEIDVFCSGESAKDICDQIAALVADFLVVKEDNVVRLSATRLSQSGGVNKFPANIECPSWEEIAGNYSGSAADPFGRMRQAILDGSVSGKLAIMDGPPGTGKTYAIRSLLRALKDKYKPIFITDPDVFFVTPSYYYELISDVEDERPDEDGSRPTNLLIIMEDAVNALLSENRNAGGAPVSKLLNLTDGLMTKARNDLFILTFNEPITELDRAVTRPGRCLARIHFPPLNAKEAAKWLNERGVNVDKVPNPATLASLYQLIGDEQILSDQSAQDLGF